MAQQLRAVARPDPDDDTDDPWLNGREAAHHLGIGERSFTRLRSRGEGPRYERNERTGRVRYRKSDLDAWGAQQWRDQ